MLNGKQAGTIFAKTIVANGGQPNFSNESFRSRAVKEIRQKPEAAKEDCR